METKLGRSAAEHSHALAETALPDGALIGDERSSRYKNSLSAAAEIAAVIPGGVDSPFRAFHEVGGQAIFIQSAKGAYLTDLDGNKYIDYLGAWGPAILGHAAPQVVQAVKTVLEQGAVIGTPHTLELELAKRVIEAVPSIESVRFVSSGTEAVMSAVRLARGYSGRQKIVMFAGGYHGHSDSVLASTGHQSSSGLVDAAKNSTLLANYNDLQSVEEILIANKDTVAAILVEPVSGSMGLVPPQSDFLPGLRTLADKYGCLLIFDEVITGFRVARGGAQALYQVRPDLTCFGKALGGGMPIGAYGGKKEIMNKLMPQGDVYQAGTFSGNPATMAGGVATLDILQDAAVYQRLERSAKLLFAGLGEIIAAKSYPVQLARVGSMFGIIFSHQAVTDFESSKNIDVSSFARFFHFLLDRGVYLPPSPFDAAVVSAAHSDLDTEKTIEEAGPAFAFAFKN